MDSTLPILRDTTDADLSVFFGHLSDPVAVRMAAFTAKDPSDRAAFNAHWARIRSDPTIFIQTIIVGDRIAGHIALFGPTEEREITYWLGREFWGREIATAAVCQLLQTHRERPLYARAASDNIASIRVLQKVGFALVAQETSFASGRGAEIEEVILKLDQV